MAAGRQHTCLITVGDLAQTDGALGGGLELRLRDDGDGLQRLGIEPPRLGPPEEEGAAPATECVEPEVEMEEDGQENGDGERHRRHHRHLASQRHAWPANLVTAGVRIHRVKCCIKLGKQVSNHQWILIYKKKSWDHRATVLKRRE